MSGAGINVLPNFPKCPIRVLMSYRTFRSVGCRYLCIPELTVFSGTRTDAGTGIRTDMGAYTGGIYVPSIHGISRRYPIDVKTLLTFNSNQHIITLKHECTLNIVLYMLFKRYSLDNHPKEIKYQLYK